MELRWSRILFCAFLLFPIWEAASARAESDARTPRAGALSGLKELARPAIERGLRYLEKENTSWLAENKCAACHHLPMAIWAFNEAKIAGVPVNEPLLADFTKWTLETDEMTKVFPPSGARPAAANGGVNLELSYLILATERSSGAERVPGVPREMLDRFFADLAQGQGEDGSWFCYDRRVPVAQGPEAVTLLTRLALTSRLAQAASWPGGAERIARADAWIAARGQGEGKMNDNQPLNLRLLLALRSGKPEEEWRPLMDRLAAAQEPDGGWKQVEGVPADAYATGQTLYALIQAGLDPRGPVAEKAVRFLLDAQYEDGTFKVADYIHGVGQPGAHNPRPNTNSAAAWAIIGLCADLGPRK